ncbi:hypothetical protein [Actinoplanes couchii]|uniref:Transcriptional regulator n=1 Tax=Actinoplanes couchii TaxID=403638 RepID=A0ABQ3XSD2_9ACTN|nr:hypothetical protein [Actinoplanes couchii]MDR6315927.1 hypothetical protein [Actinoplanes couchii]GID61423.1 hypothetical protein Aco03nite_098270 [Actinoplanes couchii]
MLTGEARSRLEAGYATFAALNIEVKEICTRWQVRDTATFPMRVNDHSDAAYDFQVLSRLAGVHDRALAWLAEASGLVPRWRDYGLHLDAALRATRAGDITMLTGTAAESYHHVWMHLHDELLTELGRMRSEEDA